MSLRSLVTIAALMIGWVAGARAAAPLWQEAQAPAEMDGRAGSLPDFTGVVGRAMGAVVSISTVQASEDSDESIKSFLEPEENEPQKGLGSGFFIHPSGYLVTNAHVIEDVSGIRVSTLIDGRVREYPARVLGADPPTDVALLKIDAEGESFPVLPLGDSDRLLVAEWIAAIGNPYGLTHTVTLGIVSYKGRTDVMPAGRDGYYDYVQTDAPINPGNSGGPILNTRGEVVAIANAVNAVGQGIGFAIPINMAKQVLAPLLRDGRVARSWIGISVEDLTPERARELGLPATLSGVMVSEVAAGAPGEKAGLQVGDVITSFNGVRVGDAQRLRWLAALGPNGQKVPITLNRGGQAQHLMALLAPMPDQPPAQTFTGPEELGLVVHPVDVPAARAAGLAVPFGARVLTVKAGSPAAQAGLERGDVLLKIDEATLYASSMLPQALSKVRRGEEARLVVRRGANTLFLTLRRP